MRAPIGITNRYRDNIAEYSNKMRIYEYTLVERDRYG